MKPHQIRRIHIEIDNKVVEWCWTTKGDCRVLLYDRYDNNRKIEINCEPTPSSIKNYIISHYYSN